MSVKLIFETKIRIAAILKKGPKGIIFSLFENKIIMATGKAIKVAKKMVQIDIGNPNTKPNKNISLMSPPPRDSFLKALSPNNFKEYMAIKAPIPEYMWYAASSKPSPNIYIIIITRVETINTSSNIIMYSISLTITIIRLEVKINAINKSNDNSKEW